MEDATSGIYGNIDIPTKLSELVNDCGFITDSAITGKIDMPSGGLSGQVLTKTSTGVAWADGGGGGGGSSGPVEWNDVLNKPDIATISGALSSAIDEKLNEDDYVSPYCLPLTTASASDWLGASTKSWTDTSIVSSSKKIDVLTYTSPNPVLSFPTISSSANEMNVRTYELWVKIPGSESTGITSIFTPSTYSVVNSASFPTALKGEDSTKSYTYHVFVIRFIPRTSTIHPTVTYSYSFSSDENIVGG